MAVADLDVALCQRLADHDDGPPGKGEGFDARVDFRRLLPALLEHAVRADPEGAAPDLSFGAEPRQAREAARRLRPQAEFRGPPADRAPERVFAGKELELLRYAGKLTTDVAHMVKSDVDALRAAGCDDGQILEVNQVCAYFNYSNRLLNGLGVTTQGDVIGYYKDEE